MRHVAISFIEVTMDSQINYSLVGAFVLLLSTATVGFGYWLFVGGSDRQYEPYVIYATDSVSGLNTNARVFYHGVDVGWVDQIQIDPNNPDRIEIRVSIAEGTPIRQDTTAQLRPQGVTGLSVLDLSGGSPDSPIPTKEGQSCCPVIRYEPSLFSKLEGGVQDTLVYISVIGQRLERLFNEENVDALQNTIKDISEITATIANERDAISRIVNNTEQTTANIANLTQSADQLVARAHSSMDLV
ncbi:MAG TPA: MCE family protein, partial [Halothiobacillaceae bacterium]|nr:MCE family protein [Halothiobacillaceae bacterium]